jgi:hypothetical protein
MKIRTKEGSAAPSSFKQFEHEHSIVSNVIREIEIWRVAVLMINRYADKARPRKRGSRGGRTSLALDSRWCGNDGTGSCCRFLPRLVEDHCGAFFGDHGGRGVGVGRGDGRHHRCVDDAQPFEAVGVGGMIYSPAFRKLPSGSYWRICNEPSA